MQATHLYKCPGPYEHNHKIMYQYVGASTEDEFEAALKRGFFATIREAAEAAGPKALKVVKQKQSFKRLSKMKGLPIQPPEVKIDVKVEKIEEFIKVEEIEPVEDPVRNSRSIDKDKRDRIISQLHDGISVKEIAEEAGVSTKTVGGIRKEYVLH